MINDERILCVEAEFYFYEWIGNPDSALIPDIVKKHICQCKYCQDEIRYLHESLDAMESEESGNIFAGNRRMEILRLHLSLANMPIGCREVKPLLVAMANPTLIPAVETPVTVHLEHCHECQEDLKLIARLNLRQEQLERLGQLLAAGQESEDHICALTRDLAGDLAVMDWRRASKDILRHASTCPDCRRLILEKRQEQIDRLLGYGEAEGCFCDSMQDTDIFDYCFPVGIDPFGDQYAEFRQSFIGHVSNCPKCLGRLQQLHEQICHIIERPDSDVVTTFSIPSDADQVPIFPKNDRDVDRRFEVNVESTATRPEEVAAGSNLIKDKTKGCKRWGRKISLPRMFPATAAAAAILICAILLMPPTANALTLENVFRAIVNVANVHITYFNEDRDEPVREKWVSRSAKIYAVTKPGEHTVWQLGDDGNPEYRVSSSLGLCTLDAKTSNFLKEQFNGTLELMPFDSLSEMPKSVKWTHKDDQQLQDDIVHVYDLIWSEARAGSATTYYKRRYFIKEDSDVPVRVESYLRRTDEEPYRCQTVKLIKQVSQNEIVALAKQLTN